MLTERLRVAGCRVGFLTLVLSVIIAWKITHLFVTPIHNIKRRNNVTCGIFVIYSEQYMNVSRMSPLAVRGFAEVTSLGGWW